MRDHTAHQPYLIGIEYMNYDQLYARFFDTKVAHDRDERETSKASRMLAIVAPGDE